MNDANDIQEHVLENVRAISALHERAERDVTRHQRAVEVVTRAAARPRTLYVVAIVVLAWAGMNGALHALHRGPLDPPPFYWLQATMTLAGLLLTIVILATQRREATLAEQRAHLDLQMSHPADPHAVADALTGSLAGDDEPE